MPGGKVPCAPGGLSVPGAKKIVIHKAQNAAREQSSGGLDLATRDVDRRLLSSFLKGTYSSLRSFSGATRRGRTTKDERSVLRFAQDFDTIVVDGFAEE